jgi:hypothetical protein
MNNIPAVPYYGIVLMYAKARGLKTWTYKDWLEAIKRYEKDAAILN